MRQQQKNVRDHLGPWQRTILLTMSFYLVAGFLWAEEPKGNSGAENVAPADENVIVTDIDLDQMKIDDPNAMDSKTGKAVERIGKSSNPQELQIKEDQVIAINRSLKNIIEENEKLKEQNQDLDNQLRQLRGQRNIDLNRTNTISVERDAYKSQNEAMSGVTQKYAEDIEDLKRQLTEKEKQLAQQPPAEQMETDGTMVVETDQTKTIGLGTIQIRKEDREQGKDILKMLDDVKKKSQKLKTDEAKIHYNMGNKFFKEKDFRRATSEFQSALRLSPQDAFAHFNLAFVSGEYMADYKTAITHYKEYLELNPQADDAPLVREKIIEAELAIRSEIPTTLEEDIQKEKARSKNNF